MAQEIHSPIGRPGGHVLPPHLGGATHATPCRKAAGALGIRPSPSAGFEAPARPRAKAIAQSMIDFVDQLRTNEARETKPLGAQYFHKLLVSTNSADPETSRRLLRRAWPSPLPATPTSPIRQPRKATIPSWGALPMDGVLIIIEPPLAKYARPHHKSNTGGQTFNPLQSPCAMTTEHVYMQLHDTCWCRACSVGQCTRAVMHPPRSWSHVPSPVRRPNDASLRLNRRSPNCLRSQIQTTNRAVDPL